MIHANDLNTAFKTIRFGNRDEAIAQVEAILSKLQDRPVKPPGEDVEVTLEQAITHLVEAKIKGGRSKFYIKSLDWYLRHFGKGRLHLPAHEVLTLENLEAWFDSRKEAPSAHLSNMGRLGTLCNYSWKRGWIGSNPYMRMEKPMQPQKPPQILTVRQAAKCLVWARRYQPRMLGWLALALMAGVRPVEAEQVRWEDVSLELGTVKVAAAVSKVKRRRIVHLMPAAVAWLRIAKEVGADLPINYQARRRCLKRLRVALGWKRWPQDIARHTAASYWLADWRDAGRVAFELGNSASILLRHYRELVTEDQAKRFWNLIPKRKTYLVKRLINNFSVRYETRRVSPRHEPIGGSVTTAEPQSKCLTANPGAMFSSGPANIIEMPAGNGGPKKCSQSENIRTEAVW